MSWLLALAGGFIFGLFTFFLLPLLAGALGWDTPRRVLFALAAQPIKRLAIVVSEHNDLVLKTMRFDALGVERITLDGEDKAFEDPGGALHSWLGVPFALADEESGTLFDPRHAALGMRKRVYDERNEASFAATDDEYATYGVTKWVPGAFTLPDAYQLVDLSAATELVDGGERSEYPKRVKELYKHSRDPFGEGMSMLRFFLPIIAFGATFGGIWLMASQVGVPGGGGGGGTVVQGSLSLIGALLLTPLGLGGGDGDENDSHDDPLAKEPGVEPDDNGGTVVKTGDGPDGDGGGGDGNGRDDSDDDDGDDGPMLTDRQAWWAKRILGSVGVLALAAVAEVGLFLFAGLTGAIVGPIAFLAGLATVPMLALTLGKLAPNSIGGAFTGLFFKLAFASYRDPVITWTPDRYEVREADDLGEVAPEPQRYSLFGTRVGFTFTPGADSFGEAGVTTETLGAYTEGSVATDGGQSRSNVPSSRYDHAPELAPDGMGGFVPKRGGDYGVLTSIAMGWFSNSADGTKSMRELLQAKEEFGGDEPPVSDKTILYLTAAMGFIGAAAGVGIFVL